MLVREAMNPQVIVAKPEATVMESARIMSQYGVGSLVILENGKIIGIVTERDVIGKVVARGQDPRFVKLEDIMTKDVITVEADQTVEDACESMTENNIKKLPVIENEKLVGIITATDIVAIQPKMMKLLAKIMLVRGSERLAG